MKNSKRFILPVFLLLISIFTKYFLERFTGIPADLAGIFSMLGTVLIIISMAWILYAGIRTFKRKFLEKFDTSLEDNLRSRKFQTQFDILERIIVFLIILISIGAILMLFDNLKLIWISLYASAGVAGIIIGFSAQRIIGAVIAGIQIAITQPIRLDDVVIIEGEWGRIEEITLTYVVEQIWDQRRLIVPTTHFFEKPFQNWTRTSAEILGTVFIYTDYNVPFDKLREELTRLLHSSPLWDKRVNVLQVTDAKERTLEIRALMSAKDSGIAFDLRVYVREGLIAFLQKNYPESLPRTRVVMEDSGITKNKE